MRRILIVDAHEPLRHSLSEFFERNGYRVDATGASHEAESLLARGGFEAAVIEVSLSGAGGREGLELLEFTRLACPATRAVMLTSSGGRLEESEARRRGAAGFLTKPFPLQRLLAAVRAVP